MSLSSYHGRWLFRYFIPPIRLKSERHCSIVSPAALLRHRLPEVSLRPYNRRFNHSALAETVAVPELATYDHESPSDDLVPPKQLGKVLNTIDSCLLSLEFPSQRSFSAQKNNKAKSQVSRHRHFQERCGIIRGSREIEIPTQPWGLSATKAATIRISSRCYGFCSKGEIVLPGHAPI